MRYGKQISGDSPPQKLAKGKSGGLYEEDIDNDGMFINTGSQSGHRKHEHRNAMTETGYD